MGENGFLFPTFFLLPELSGWMLNGDILLAEHHIENVCRIVNLESVKDFFFQISYLEVKPLWRSFSHSPSLPARRPRLQHPNREKIRANLGQRTDKPHQKKRNSEGRKQKGIEEKVGLWEVGWDWGRKDRLKGESISLPTTKWVWVP